jgi:hypothetical protein
MNEGNLKLVVAEIISRTPEWIRHDLGAKGSTARLPAEPTLAAMIVAAISSDAGEQAD